jgi:hypothetical protein
MKVLASPRSGGSPSHQAVKASTGSGQRARNVARRIRTAWMTSDDHRPAHDVRHRLEAVRQAEAAGQLRDQVAALPVEAADRLLEVGKARPVLDVEERRPLQPPGQHVRPTRELEVLVRLVERHDEAHG